MLVGDVAARSSSKSKMRAKKAGTLVRVPVQPGRCTWLSAGQRSRPGPRISWLREHPTGVLDRPRRALRGGGQPLVGASAFGFVRVPENDPGATRGSPN